MGYTIMSDWMFLLHVSCGENDAGVKILTLDTDAFLDNLKPVM